jgi:hypothetical protein
MFEKAIEVTSGGVGEEEEEEEEDGMVLEEQDEEEGRKKTVLCRSWMATWCWKPLWRKIRLLWLRRHGMR